MAVGAAALMAADNLLLVHSRIATLDIYAVTAMIWAAVLYLRGRPLLAGVVIGVGACAKEVAPYVLFALRGARAAAGAPGPQRGGTGACPGGDVRGRRGSGVRRRCWRCSTDRAAV